MAIEVQSYLLQRLGKPHEFGKYIIMVMLLKYVILLKILECKLIANKNSTTMPLLLPRK